MLSSAPISENRTRSPQSLSPPLGDSDDIEIDGDNMEALLVLASLNDLDTSEELGVIANEASHTFPEATDKEIVVLIKESLAVLEQVRKLRVQLEAMETKHHKIIQGIVSEPLGILERQYNMALDILLCQRENMQNLDAIREKYKDLGNYAIVIAENQEICYNMLTHCLNLNSKVLIKDLRRIIEKLIERPSRKRLGELQVIMSKLETVCECLPFAATCDNADLFALAEDDPYWEQVKKYVNIETLGPSTQVRRSYKNFSRQLLTGVSMFSRGANQKEGLMKTITLGLGGLYDFFASDQAQRRANLFYSKPDQKTAFQIWNLLDEKSVLRFYKVSFPTVEHSKRIYLPRQYATLTFECVQKALMDQTINTAQEISMQAVDLGEVFKEYKTPVPSYKELRKANPQNIPLRIISTMSLPITRMGFIRDNMSKSAGSTPTQKNSYFGSLKKVMSHITHLGKSKIPHTDVDPYFDGVILHIHGGGFVAMSSASHQAYTRQWAQMVKKPILSVDYRLAPQNPYPAALDDCWQVYNWMLNDMQETIGIIPSKIILVGDSAGGNLALGVTLLAIKNGIRAPDGLFLAYPALKLEPNSYSPSLLLALDDQVIPHSVLKMIAKVYIPPGGRPDKDPLLSPSNAKSELLEKLPPVRIMVGDRDPFHDECWRFTDKLRKLNKDVKMTVYKDMPHGFLGFDMPGGMSEAKHCVQDGAQFIMELLEK